MLAQIYTGVERKEYKTPDLSVGGLWIQWAFGLGWLCLFSMLASDEECDMYRDEVYLKQRRFYPGLLYGRVKNSIRPTVTSTYSMFNQTLDAQVRRNAHPVDNNVKLIHLTYQSSLLDKSENNQTPKHDSTYVPRTQSPCMDAYMRRADRRICPSTL
ncbi:uncharacterized protein CLUP02_13682 [Colletotrichum lupini]|uniref:Uncharacterized protein n=1 Tax=Colletotrichum lupini TaxID=145971 RepID=A0A9Q8T2S7_9PEZI|nr:uncharacterized protein CLUP02_13682 [Colletotrichum lupini]UQC88159.1 hypothetical protein CLUP02_13682 [Colletotrichum lupini]